MADRWIIPIKVDLLKGENLKPCYQQGIMLPGDDQGHIIEVTIMSGGAPAEVAGNVRGYFIRQGGDWSTVVCNGSLSGNVASVTMSPQCYAYTGQLRCVVRIENTNGPDFTLIDTIFYVHEGVGDNIVDPGSPIQDVTELLEYLDEMAEATENAQAATSYIASEYSMFRPAIKPYAVGDYVIHDGGLYRCTTAITSAEMWTPEHWEQVVFGNEVSDVKSATQSLAENGYYIESQETVYIATSDGQIMNSSALPVTSPTQYGNRGYHWFTAQELTQSIEIDTTVYSYNLAYSKNGSKAGYTDWLSASPIVFDSSITYDTVGINIKRNDNAALSETEFNKTLHYLTSPEVIGNLATKEYAVAKQQNPEDNGKALGINSYGVVVPLAELVYVDDTLSVQGDAADAEIVGSRILSIVNDGYYTINSGKKVQLTRGMITTSGTIDANRAYAGYAYLTNEQINAQIAFDTTKYKYCLYYELNGQKVAYPGWVTSSPVSIDFSYTFDKVGITLQSLTSTTFTDDDLDNSLSYNALDKIGKLVTKDSIRGSKCIYPDGFSSRIKPDIYFNGRFVADIDIDSYKINGIGEVWVATNGNDTTGDGTEDNPYATITKALTSSAATIKIKAGTYSQGTHYANHADFAGKNIIGVGNVTLQNNASGNYPTVTASAYIENIIVKHGNATTNAAFIATCNASGQKVCFVGCTFRDGGGNGLSVTGIDAVLVNCKAYGNRLDGFNYHDKTVSNVTYVPNVLEIDCVAYNNGSSESGIDSCNGSTAHDGTKIIRLNGEYYSCYGGVIAEIARASEEPTISVNYGVLAHDSTGPNTYKASFWASVNAQMYLYDCKSYGGDYDISAINDSKIVSWRLTSGRDNPSVNAASTATVIQH